MINLQDNSHQRSEVLISKSVLIHGDMWQEVLSHSVLPSVSTHALHRGWCNIVVYVIYDVDRRMLWLYLFYFKLLEIFFMQNMYTFYVCFKWSVCVCVCVCVYSRCHGEPLIINHVIDKQATRSITGIKHKLLAVGKKLDIINTVDDTCSFPCTLKLLKIFAILCQHKYTILGL